MYSKGWQTFASNLSSNALEFTRLSFFLPSRSYLSQDLTTHSLPQARCSLVVPYEVHIHLCLYCQSLLFQNHSFYLSKLHHYFKVQIKDQFLQSLMYQSTKIFSISTLLLNLEALSYSLVLIFLLLCLVTKLSHIRSDVFANA